MFSIKQRLSLSTAVVLVVMLLAVGVLLDRAIALSIESVVRGKLKLHTYVLMALAEYSDGRVDMPSVLSEQRFNTPDSGLIAFIATDTGRAAWQSRSAEGKHFQLPAVEKGEWLFGVAQDAEGGSYYVSVYGTRWRQGGETQSITFSVLEDRHSYDGWVSELREGIVIALLVFGAVLLTLQVLILRWSLKPLRQAARDVDAMNEGQLSALQGTYPSELHALTDSLNRLLDNERRQQSRYRDTLADLSHSLKTPLTVLQGLADDRDEQGQPLDNAAVLQAVAKHGGRMREIIDYQLQRASLAQANVSSASVAVRPLVDSVLAALRKVYADKHIDYTLSVPATLQFRCDENDLVEVLGNVLDNACKHCRRKVAIAASHAGEELHLWVEDDGSGVPKERREDILQRGVRLDTRAEGQGFGLAIVADIVASYDGRIAVTESKWGGARFDICLR